MKSKPRQKEKMRFIVSPTVFLVVFHLWVFAVAYCKKNNHGHKENYRYSALKDDKQLQEGQLNYNLVVRDSQMPRYGSCWKNALKELEEGCKHLTDDLQRWLALQFTNCFLEKAGQTTYPCENNDDISVCLSQMNNNGFTAFTNFFTHTQSMCYFLQTQVWQEETENTVAK